MTVYLDNAATTRVCKEAAEAAAHVMTECYGNPSSPHKLGRDAKHILDTAKAQVASVIGANPEEMYFTSGGTESNTWALQKGALIKKRIGSHIISTALEHDSIRKNLDYMESIGFQVTRLAPNAAGIITPDAVMAALRPETALVSLMSVNNETGTITDIPLIAKKMKEVNTQALLHTDAVQAFLKIPIHVSDYGADLISISSHKIHGPKGVGALYVKKGLRISPLLLGGMQEGGFRGGTEGLPQIAAFGAAASLGWAHMKETVSVMSALRETLISILTARIPKLQVIGGGAPHILNIACPGYGAEILMNLLERENIYVSRSSACKKGKRSHVLEAMRLPNTVIDGALRISFSRFTTQEEIFYFADKFTEAYEQILPRL